MMIQNLEQNEKKEVTLLSKGTSFFGWTIEYTLMSSKLSYFEHLVYMNTILCVTKCCIVKYTIRSGENAYYKI